MERLCGAVQSWSGVSVAPLVVRVTPSRGTTASPPHAVGENAQTIYPTNVKLLQLKVEHAPRRLVFKYTVADGVCQRREYMTDFLASIGGLPASVVECARQLSDAVDFDPVEPPSQQVKSLAAYHQIAERVRCAPDSFSQRAVVASRAPPLPASAT